MRVKIRAVAVKANCLGFYRQSHITFAGNNLPEGSLTSLTNDAVISYGYLCQGVYR